VGLVGICDGVGNTHGDLLGHILAEYLVSRLSMNRGF
jgi:serine/threonine protein phosphatase PrpC